MNARKRRWIGFGILTAALVLMSDAASVNAQDKKPNILFIMGDDIGWMQPGCYHRGLMVGETPNIDRIAKEGGMFMHYYAESSCTAGRCAFVTGMHPYPGGHAPAAVAGRHFVPAARHPVHRQVHAGPRLHHRPVRQEPPRRPPGLAADGARVPGVLGLPLPPRRHAAGELPGHQQEPDRAGGRAADEDGARFPASSRPPGAIDPKDGLCMAAPRPVL